MNARNILMAIILLPALCLLAACNPEAKAVSGTGVAIQIEEGAVSSGFIEVTFTPNMDAYYHIGILPANEMPDTTKASGVRTFMALQLDRAYADYLYWRYDLLEQGTPYVAEFATHSLQYGKVERTFTYLTPGTDYFVYAFVVDAKTNKPDGRLFLHKTYTEQESMYEDAIHFEYRVDGYWDYVYPVDTEFGGVLSWVPWVGSTADSQMVAISGFDTPADYFRFEFESSVEYQDRNKVHYGIYVHNNDGLGDGSSYTLFEPGHTYYSAISLMDGYLSDKSSVIYKFRWDGPQTSFYYKNDQRLTTDW